MPALLPSTQNRSPATQLLVVMTTVVVIAGLYFGKDLVIPFALALLLSFLLSTPVAFFERLRLGRPASVLIVLMATFCGAGALLWLGLLQLTDMAEKAPQYQAHIVRKLEALQNQAGSGIVNLIQNLNRATSELSARRWQTEPRGQRKQDDRPVPVEIVRPETSVFSPSGLVSTSLAHDLGLCGAVLLLTLFMLLNRGHLRNRLFRLLGQGHLVPMTTALDEAAQKVSRYLLTQSLVNAFFGLLLGMGLWRIGVPYAPFWGALFLQLYLV